MKAIILASGEGRRLHPLTNDTPKCLLELGTKTILDYQLEHLAAVNIRNIIITTGPFEEKIKNHVSRNHPGMDVTYINNPLFAKTNYIYSLWLARNLIDDDILLLHSDILFNGKLLKNLIDSPFENGVPVNNKIEPPEKDFKALVENNTIMKIGVDLVGESSYFLLPLYKFSRNGFLMWMNEMDAFVLRGDVGAYAEDALNLITGSLVLNPVYFADKTAMEIDTPDDLVKARTLLLGSSRGVENNASKE